MAIVVDGHCVVIRRDILDDRIPGGSASYVQGANAGLAGARSACADDHLTCVSFATHEDIEAWVDLLRAAEIHADDIAICDAVTGSVEAHQWLESAQHALGFHYVWLAGEQPGKLAASLHSTMVSTESAELVEIGRDAAVTHWLDVTTGRQLRSAPPPAVAGYVLPNGNPRDEAALLAPILQALHKCGYSVESSRETFNVRLEGKAATYDVGIFANGANEAVYVYTFVARIVPVHRRVAVSEAIARLNAQIWSECFEMDWRDGQLRFRSSVFVGDGTLTPRVAERLVHEGVFAWDRHYVALMRVAYADTPPDVAIPLPSAPSGRPT